MSATSARKFREREDATIYIGAGGGQRPAGAEGGPGCTGTPTSPQSPPPATHPLWGCAEGQPRSPHPSSRSPDGGSPHRGTRHPSAGSPHRHPPVPISSAMWGCALGEKDLTEPRGCPNLGVPPLHLHCAHLPSYHGVTSPAVPPECTHGCPAGGWGTTMCVCVCVCVLGGSLELPPPLHRSCPTAAPCCPNAA